MGCTSIHTITTPSPHATSLRTHTYFAATACAHPPPPPPNHRRSQVCSRMRAWYKAGMHLDFNLFMFLKYLSPQAVFGALAKAQRRVFGKYGTRAHRERSVLVVWAGVCGWVQVGGWEACGEAVSACGAILNEGKGGASGGARGAAYCPSMCPWACDLVSAACPVPILTWGGMSCAWTWDEGRQLTAQAATLRHPLPLRARCRPCRRRCCCCSCCVDMFCCCCFYCRLWCCEAVQYLLVALMTCISVMAVLIKVLQLRFVGEVNIRNWTIAEVRAASLRSQMHCACRSCARRWVANWGWGGVSL